MTSSPGLLDEAPDREVKQEEYKDSHNDRVEESHHETSEPSTSRPWPEYNNKNGASASASAYCSLGSRLKAVYSSWSFSYMNPVLHKGKRQFKDGHHLTLDDLYDVPDDMRSEYLVNEFW